MRVDPTDDFHDRWTLRSSVTQSRRLPTAEQLFLFFDHSDVGYQITANDNLSLHARNLFDRTHPQWGPKQGFNLLAQLHLDWTKNSQNSKEQTDNPER